MPGASYFFFSFKVTIHFTVCSKLNGPGMNHKRKGTPVLLKHPRRFLPLFNFYWFHSAKSSWTTQNCKMIVQNNWHLEQKSKFLSPQCKMTSLVKELFRFDNIKFDISFCYKLNREKNQGNPNPKCKMRNRSVKKSELGDDMSRSGNHILYGI